MMSRSEPNATYGAFKVEPLSGALGGTVHGLDLAATLPASTVSDLYQALLDFKVLFFRDQLIDDNQHLTFARCFGTPQGPGPIPSVPGFPMIRAQRYDANHRLSAASRYHADDTFRTYPSKVTVLRALAVPPVGGDTVWVDMEKAFAALSPLTREYLASLTAEHNGLRAVSPEFRVQWQASGTEGKRPPSRPMVHPVVRVHPDTGRPALFVNELLTERIVELRPVESEHLLRMLYDHSYRPEFQCRFKWAPQSVALWDNRCTQHRGIDDFYPAHRLMHRISIADTQRPSREPAREPCLDFGDLAFVPIEDLVARG